MALQFNSIIYLSSFCKITYAFVNNKKIRLDTVKRPGYGHTSQTATDIPKHRAWSRFKYNHLAKIKFYFCDTVYTT